MSTLDVRTLDAVGRALVDDARAVGERIEADADGRARSLVAEAEREASGRVAAARAAGEAESAAQLARDRTNARRQARQLVLGAEAQARASLVEQVQRSLEELRGTDRYRDLLDLLAGLSRSQLGPDAHVVADPPDGGVVASAGERRVDYTLPTLVERATDALGPELEELWR